MDESLHANDLLLKYFDGEMNSEEQEAFRMQLLENEQLREQYESLQITRGAIRQYGVSQKVRGMHNKLVAELNQQPEREVPKVIRFRKSIRYTMAVAASLLLLFIGVQVYLFIRLSPASVFEDAYVDYSPAAVRGGAEANNDLHKKYAEKNYSSVVAVPAREVRSATDSLFVALSHLKLQKAESAIPFLKGLNKTGSLYKEDAEFYLGITYIKTRDYNKALSLLKEIRSNKKHLYHNQVGASLIRKVRMLKWK